MKTQIRIVAIPGSHGFAKGDRVEVAGNKVVRVQRLGKGWEFVMPPSPIPLCER